MQFVWPPIISILEQRKKTIADGLAAGERGRHELELAEKRAVEILHEVKGKAAEVIAQAQKRAGEIVEEAKVDARDEGGRLLTAARAEIDQEVNQAREQLRGQLASIAIVGAQKVLEKEVNLDNHRDMLNDLATQI